MIEQRIKRPFARLLMVPPLVRERDAKIRRGVEFRGGQGPGRFGDGQPATHLTARQHRHLVERVQVFASLVLKRILKGDELVALVVQLSKYFVSRNHRVNRKRGMGSGE